MIPIFFIIILFYVIFQTTYENFRYRYDHRANPYNRGVVENFKEIFFTSIPPSKNNFLAKVPQELGLQVRAIGRGFVSPNMAKGVGDIEMGRKPVAWEEAGLGFGALEGMPSNEGLENKEGGFGDASPDLSRDIPLEGMEGRAGLHPRRSSWGRKSGSWEISPEVLALAAGVGESNRVGSGSRSKMNGSL